MLQTISSYVPQEILNQILSGIGTVAGLMILYILSQVISWLKTKLSVDRASQLSAAIDKLVMFGVTRAQDMIAARGPEGWRSEEVKDYVKGIALTHAKDKFPDAMAQSGIDPNSEIGEAKLSDAIERAIPDVFTRAAASPATPPAPVPAVPAVVVAGEAKA